MVERLYLPLEGYNHNLIIIIAFGHYIKRLFWKKINHFLNLNLKKKEKIGHLLNYSFINLKCLNRDLNFSHLICQLLIQSEATYDPPLPLSVEQPNELIFLCFPLVDCSFKY